MIIRYHSEFVKVTGSINAAILMSKLEYWFRVKEGKTFYKFLAPCEHECYRQGDSWTEELIMSLSEVRFAFKRIGVAYKSKKAFKESPDLFQGKLYASYYDRIRKRTYYLRNHELVEKILKEHSFKMDLDDKQEVGFTHKVKVEADTLRNEISRNDETQSRLSNKDFNKNNNKDINGDISISNSVSRNSNKIADGYEDMDSESQNETIGLTSNKSADQIISLVRAEDKVIRLVSNEDDSQVTDNEQRNEKIADIKDKYIMEAECEAKRDSRSGHPIPFDKICEMYNSSLGEILGRKTALSNQEKKCLEEMGQDYSLSQFEEAFKKTAASRFLCGKTDRSQWKASLAWLLNKENMDKVLSGKYDEPKKKNGGMAERVKSFLEMDSHGWDFDEIERLEMRLIDQKIAQMNKQGISV